MPSLQNVCTLVFLAVLISACTRQVEMPVVDYRDARQSKLPGWACHQINSIKQDSLSRESFLEIEAFPQRTYPGFELSWLQGDWCKYNALQIKTRICNRDSMQFFVSLWDGTGSYDIKNRYQAGFFIKKDWAFYNIPFKHGIVTGNGHAVDLRHIQRAVFFTDNENDTVQFQVEKIELKY
jgi:hypothetical protein